MTVFKVDNRLFVGLLMWVSFEFFVGHLTHQLTAGGEEVLRRRHCPLTVACSRLDLCCLPPPLTTTAVVPLS